MKLKTSSNADILSIKLILGTKNNRHETPTLRYAWPLMRKDADLEDMTSLSYIKYFRQQRKPEYELVLQSRESRSRPHPERGQVKGAKFVCPTCPEAQQPQNMVYRKFCYHAY